MNPRAAVIMLSLATAAQLAGCGLLSTANKPDNARANSAITEMWARDIQSKAQDGDWILMRSYATAGDVITLFTSGEDISHSAMYDAHSGTVIEGVSPTVKESALRDVIQHKRHVIIVRPHGLSKAQRRDSVQRARSKIGAKYDWGGLIGVDSEDKYYCSELLYWASRIGPRRTRPLVISPARLMDYGEVIYWSGHRDDAQIHRAAMAARTRRRTHRAPVTAQRSRSM